MFFAPFSNKRQKFAKTKPWRLDCDDEERSLKIFLDKTIIF